jgi:hypothetical protein
MGSRVETGREAVSRYGGSTGFAANLYGVVPTGVIPRHQLHSEPRLCVAVRVEISERKLCETSTSHLQGLT